MRATWDETWLTVASAMAARSKCTNRKVGAIIVDPNNRPVSVGYNGAPAGLSVGDSCQSFCSRSNKSVADRSNDYGNCVSVHAESNALLFADRSVFVGGTIYVTNPCCWDCAKLVANSGLARVVFRVSIWDQHADWQKSVEFLRACGLVVDVLVNIEEN